MANMKNLIIITLILFAFSTANAQYALQWNRTYNGPGNYNDAAISLAIDNQKNVYVAGSSFGSDSTFDFTLVKYNSVGTELWTARYNGTGNGNDFLKAMTTDSQGNIYLTGLTYTSSQSLDYATIKYNSAGVRLWVATYNGTGSGIDNPSSIIMDNSGNIYVTGYSYGGIAQNYNYATVKYNSDGVQQWAIDYNGPGNASDEAYAIALDTSQNIYVTGSSAGAGSELDYATVKYSPAGVQLLSARYNGPGNDIDIAHAVKIDNNNNIIVTGFSRGNGNYDYATIKYNPSGNQQWVSRFDGTMNLQDIPSSLATDSQGNIYVTGVTNSDLGGFGTQSNYATLKYNSSGSTQWTAIYNGTGNNKDSASSLTVDESGDVFVTGKSIGIGTQYDVATIQYDSTGVPEYTARYNGSDNLNDAGTFINIDNFGSIYVAGIISSSSTLEDFGTLKYSKMTGINTVSSNTPDGFELGQNYPNPFNPLTVINYSIPENGKTDLKIYDILGNEVAVLVNEYQSPGTYSVNWNAGNFSSGVYYYTLVTDNFTHTRKMVLTK